jgi:hypothetical protein
VETNRTNNKNNHEPFFDASKKRVYFYGFTSIGLSRHLKPGMRCLSYAILVVFDALQLL